MRGPVEFFRGQGFTDEQVVAALVESGMSALEAGNLVAFTDGDTAGDVGPFPPDSEQVQQAFAERLFGFSGYNLHQAAPEEAVNQDDIEDEALGFGAEPTEEEPA